MKRHRPIVRHAGLIATILTVILPCGMFAADEPSEAPLNVVLLYSGDFFIPAAVLQDRAMREAFNAGTKRPVNFYLETLHAYNPSPIDFDTEFTSFMRLKYQGLKIDLIITAGTSALNLLERRRPELWPEVPAVFCSVDETGNLHRKFPPGMTGLTIKFDPAGTLDFALQIQPNARRVVVVAGTSEADRYWLPEIQNHLRSRHPALSATYLTNQTVTELTEELHKLSAETIVLCTTILADASGKRYVPREVVARLSAASGAPIYGLHETMLNYGIVGGVIPSSEEHGRLAAKLASRIIAGEKPDSVPVQPSLAAVPMVDWRQLQRWNINESRLPPGSMVRFRPPTLWEEHQDYLIGGLCIMIAQAATIVALLVQRGRRRRAEAFARDLGGRLINAREDERRRIARDLHDDLSQRLALISVELEMFGQKPPAEREAIIDRMHGFSGKVKGVSSEVHRLAHELHPSKLNQLGLVAAVRGFCKELATAHEIAIPFETRDVPRTLPDDVALCVYRVSQEALQNAIKHSGATGVKVELTANVRELHLLVTDDGQGFDPQAESASGSLGIVSMRERVRMVQGQISVQSRPGEGTRIEVRVPIAAVTGADGS